MYNLGVIGCGMIAEKGHLPAIRHVPELQNYALYDRDFERAKALQRQFDVPHAYRTEDEFFGADLDAIVICTPAPVHHTNVMDAAESGVHVLCEKPLGMNEEEMLEMEAVMKEAGLRLFTGFNYRFSQSARDIRRLVREGAIGEVRLLRLIYNWHLHGKWQWTEDGERIENPLRVGRMNEGGPLVDCGVHQIDLARWWLGSEVEWQRGIGVWLDDYEAPDHMYLHMGHDCGAHTTVEVGFSYNATSQEPRTHFLYELVGTDGVIRYNREEHAFELRNSHGTQHLPWHPEKSFVGMYEEFARALESGRPQQMPTARDGILASRIAQDATEQAIRERNQSPPDQEQAVDVQGDPHEIPLDAAHLPMSSPTTRGAARDDS
ncbi:MAG: Gfo/Idh/MocA family oxidoreductase [Salinibacter sp.]|uniref:Gfo/Idh/MocA family protein n=1 Tax=Salinibacter sp. TaxID=2065818 RepID=UPI002FC2C9B0